MRILNGERKSIKLNRAIGAEKYMKSAKEIQLNRFRSSLSNFVAHIKQLILPENSLKKKGKKKKKGGGEIVLQFLKLG